ncbi:MAG: MurT ligase domain-containing protein [Lachnospiraceae bacterium]|nr:MurT ligase domain-containing protein [Lachnospiraceae bacterium]
MSLRKTLAILLSKIINRISILLGKQGVTFCGKLALKLCPDILRDLSSQVREGIFVTCGTNGKTTTNNMLNSFLKSEGKKTVCNMTGSNMLNGVVAAFVLSASLGGKLDADYAVIEIDEASTLRVFPHFKPDYMLLTNLFRDQLDRYGEIDITIDILLRALELCPDCKIIANADDVLCASLAKKSGHDFITFGINEPCKANPASTSEIREGAFCQFCGERLDYDFYHFSQLGSYHCPKCGYKRPLINYNATDISLKNGLSFKVVGSDNNERALSSNYRGFYNIYNILAAFSAASETGLELKNIDAILKSFKPENGRMESFKIGECNVLLNLAKNPAGFNQNISAVMEDDSPKDLVVVINDNAQDGKDISWLWDVDFERFSGANVKSIIVSGLRAYDMELRFKYSDIKAKAVINIEDGIKELLTGHTNNLYVLVNYTALYNTRKWLKSMED